MADEQQNQQAAPAGEAAGAEGAEGAAAPAGGNKKLFIIIGAAVLVVLIGGGVAGYFLMAGGSGDEKHEMTPEELAVSDVVFYDMPPMTVPLANEDGGARFLKLKLALELGKASDAQVVEKLLPRLQDDVQNFLRQLRGEDVQGSVAIQRLKEALLLRSNQVLAPVAVRQVLLRELLVQ